MAPFSPIQIGIIAVLFFVFLGVPSIARNLGKILDTLPMRFASVILILAVLPYDRFISLALFLVIVGIYIQHHHDDVMNVMGDLSNKSNHSFKMPSAMNALYHGGYADETHDTMDFTPNKNVQDNEFHRSAASVDEKHVLQSEYLGTKAQSLFPEDKSHADELMRGNENGSLG